MAITTYSSLSQRTTAWAAKEMLDHAEPIIVLQKFAMTKQIPKNTADNVKFRRAVPFTVSTTPLTEGTTPTSHALSYTDVSVSLAQYGDVTEISDKVQDLAEDPVLKDASMLSGEQAAETLEMVTYGVAKGGSNVFYDTDAHVRNTVNSVITLDRQRKVVRFLKAQRGRPITQMLDASPKYGTSAIEGGYIAFAHTDVEADIRKMTGFVPLAEYGSRKPLCPEECGSVEGVRYILSPLFTAFANAGGTASTNGVYSTGGTQADVYPIIFMASQALGVVALKGPNAITPMVVQPGTPSAGDPLGQRGFISWKTYSASCRLNESWLVRLECAVDDLTS
tara:strand:- start:1424 stop:2431 length:1008 start_codon:yes stop_codon:yes gene_type:complete